MISYHIISYHIISYHIITYHFISYIMQNPHIISCLVNMRPPSPPPSKAVVPLAPFERDKLLGRHLSMTQPSTKLHCSDIVIVFLEIWTVNSVHCYSAKHLPRLHKNYTGMFKTVARQQLIGLYWLLPPNILSSSLVLYWWPSHFSPINQSCLEF